MKRERAEVLATVFADESEGTFTSVTAFNMDGSGWSYTVGELIPVLDRETYVLYDVRIERDGMHLDVWFTSNVAG